MWVASSPRQMGLCYIRKLAEHESEQASEQCFFVVSAVPTRLSSMMNCDLEIKAKGNSFLP